jgi:hypothetical protein
VRSVDSRDRGENVGSWVLRGPRCRPTCDRPASGAHVKVGDLMHQWEMLQTDDVPTTEPLTKS